MVQEALTAYPKGQSGQHVLWGSLSLYLLYRVYRGGDLARRALVVVAAMGAGLFLVALASSGAGGVDPDRVGPLALAYLVQAGVMVVPTVRQWTRQPRQVQPTPVAG